MSTEPTLTVESTEPISETIDTLTETSAAPEGEKETQVEQETVTLTKQELADKLSRVEAKADAKAARREARAYREALERIQAPQQIAQQDDRKPSRAAFNGDDEAYVEAVADWKIDQRDRKAGEEKRADSMRQTVTQTEKIYQEAAKFPTFDREVFDELPLTHMIAKTIVESDLAPQLMAWMTANPDDVDRISKLTDSRQAAEIGKLEARLSVVKASKELPAPIKTVGGGGKAANGDFSSMSDEAYWDARAKMKPRWSR